MALKSLSAHKCSILEPPSSHAHKRRCTARIAAVAHVSQPHRPRAAKKSFHFRILRGRSHSNQMELSIAHQRVDRKNEPVRVRL